MNATTTPKARGKWLPLRIALLLLGTVGPIVGVWYGYYAPSNDIAWAADFETAKLAAAETGKPMLLYFTSEW